MNYIFKRIFAFAIIVTLVGTDCLQVAHALSGVNLGTPVNLENYTYVKQGEEFFFSTSPSGSEKHETAGDEVVQEEVNDEGEELIPQTEAENSILDSLTSQVKNAFFAVAVAAETSGDDGSADSASAEENVEVESQNDATGNQTETDIPEQEVPDLEVPEVEVPEVQVPDVEVPEEDLDIQAQEEDEIEVEVDDRGEGFENRVVVAPSIENHYELSSKYLKLGSFLNDLTGFRIDEVGFIYSFESDEVTLENNDGQIKGSYDEEAALIKQVLSISGHEKITYKTYVVFEGAYYTMSESQKVFLGDIENIDLNELYEVEKLFPFHLENMIQKAIQEVDAYWLESLTFEEIGTTAQAEVSDELELQEIETEEIEPQAIEEIQPQTSASAISEDDIYLPEELFSVENGLPSGYVYPIIPQMTFDSYDGDVANFTLHITDYNEEKMNVQQAGIIWSKSGEEVTFDNKDGQMALNYDCNGTAKVEVPFQDGEKLSVKVYVVFADILYVYSEVKNINLEDYTLAVDHNIDYNDLYRTYEFYEERYEQYETTNPEKTSEFRIIQELTRAEFTNSTVTMNSMLYEGGGTQVYEYGYVWSYENETPLLGDGNNDGFVNLTNVCVPENMSYTMQISGDIYITPYYIFKSQSTDDAFIVTYGGIASDTSEKEVTQTNKSFFSFFGGAAPVAEEQNRVYIQLSGKLHEAMTVSPVGVVIAHENFSLSDADLEMLKEKSSRSGINNAVVIFTGMTSSSDIRVAMNMTDIQTVWGSELERGQKIYNNYNVPYTLVDSYGWLGYKRRYWMQNASEQVFSYAVKPLWTMFKSQEKYYCVMGDNVQILVDRGEQEYSRITSSTIEDVSDYTNYFSVVHQSTIDTYGSKQVQVLGMYDEHSYVFSRNLVSQRALSLPNTENRDVTLINTIERSASSLGQHRIFTVTATKDGQFSYRGNTYDRLLFDAYSLVTLTTTLAENGKVEYTNYNVEYTLSPEADTKENVRVDLALQPISKSSGMSKFDYLIDPNGKIHYDPYNLYFIATENGDYKVTVYEKSGLSFEETIAISNIDRTPPEIKLNGEETVTIFHGDAYLDKGIEATDNKTLQSQIVQDFSFSNGFNPSSPMFGEYVQTYTATDLAGNVATKTRTIVVLEKAATVSTIQASTGTSEVSFSGQVTSVADKTIVERGFVISFTQNPTVQGNMWKINTTTGAIRDVYTLSVDNSEFTKGVIYNFRAYIKTSLDEYIYGDNQTFGLGVPNYGTFSLSVNTASTTSTAEQSVSFTIARTGGSEGTQTVYYRLVPLGQTQTTIGSTTFNDGETSKTLSVTVPAYTTRQNADPTYGLQIYKVEGGASYSATMVTRTKGSGTNYNATIMNSIKKSATILSSERMATDSGTWLTSGVKLTSTSAGTVMMADAFQDHYTTSYYSPTNMYFDHYEREDGYQMLRVDTSLSYGDTYLYWMARTNGVDNSWRTYSYSSAPISGSNGAGSRNFGARNFRGVAFKPDTSFSVYGQGDGVDGDDFYIRNVVYYFRYVDPTKPKLNEFIVAGGGYKADDAMRISLVFSEPVKTTSTSTLPQLTVTFADGKTMPMTYSGGSGGVELYFEGNVPSGSNITTNDITSVSISTNNTIITDYYGNILSNTSTTTKSIGSSFLVDTTMPTVSITANTPQAVVSTTHTAYVSVDDANSSENFEYTWSTESDVTKVGESWQKVDSKTGTVSSSGGNGEYYLHVRTTDTVGNIGYGVSGPYSIDNDPAEITITPDSSERYAKSHAVTITAVDDNSIPAGGIWYALTYSQTDAVDWGNATVIENGATVNVTAEDQTKNNIYLHVKVKDSSGSETYKSSLVYRIDKVNPVVASEETSSANVTVSVNTNDQSNHTLLIRVNTVKDEHSGMGSVRAKVTSPNGETTTVALANRNAEYFTEYPMSQLAGNSTTGIQSGTYKVELTATDLAGNAVTWDSETIAITNVDGNDYTSENVFEVLYDDTMPTISVVAKEGSNLTEWTVKGIEVVVTAQKSGGISSLKSILLPDGTIVNDGDALDLDENANCIQVEYSITRNESYTFTAIDQTGNSDYDTINVTNIDVEAPALDVHLSTTEPTKNPVTVEISLDDNMTSVKEIINGTMTQYYTGSGDLMYRINDQALFTPYDENNKPVFTFTENGTLRIEARDALGNSAVRTVAISNIDTKAPTVDISNKSYGLYNDDLRVYPIYLDNLDAPVSVRKYAILESKEPLSKDSDLYLNYKSGLDENGESGILIKNDTLNAKEYYVHMYAEDKVGNASEAIFGPYTIAKNAPPITVSVKSPNSFRQEHTATVTIDTTGTLAEGQTPTVKYAWTESQDRPSVFANTLVMSDNANVFTGNVTKSDGDGIFYLHTEVSILGELYYTSMALKFDNTAPDIVLHGGDEGDNNAINVLIHSINIVEPGVTAVDNFDNYPTVKKRYDGITREENGEIIFNTDIENTKDDGKENYYITYSAQDEAGNTTTVTRTVYVVSQQPIYVSIYEDKDYTANVNLYTSATHSMLQEIKITDISGRGIWSCDGEEITKEHLPYTVSRGDIAKLQFTPTADWFGGAVLSWQWQDSSEQWIDNQTIVSVASVNDAPYFTTDTKKIEMTVDDIAENVSFNILDIVDDVDRHNFAVFGEVSDTLWIEDIVVNGYDGTFSVKGNLTEEEKMTLVYAPTANFQGKVYTTVTITDGMETLDIPVEVTVKDKTGPQIAVTYEHLNADGSMNWINKEPIITFDVTDEYANTQFSGVGIDEVFVKPTNADDSEYVKLSQTIFGLFSFSDFKSFKFQSKEAELYDIKAVDKEGNESVLTYEVVNLDREAPQITFDYDKTFTNQNVNVTVITTDSETAVDVASGVATGTLMYRKSGDSAWIDADSDTSQWILENDTYEFIVNDNAGNVSEITELLINNIDRTKPVLEATDVVFVEAFEDVIFEANCYLDKYYINRDVRLQVIARDDYELALEDEKHVPSLVKEILYSTDQGASYATVETDENGIAYIPFEVGFDGEVLLAARDYAGNDSLDTPFAIQFQLENDNPTHSELSPWVSFNETDREKFSELNPTLLITFDEEVVKVAGGGEIEVTEFNYYWANASHDILNVANNKIQLINPGPNGGYTQAKVTLNKPLKSNTRYYISIDNDVFEDLAGNAYEGIYEVNGSDQVWQLRTGTVTIPTITGFDVLVNGTDKYGVILNETVENQFALPVSPKNDGTFDVEFLPQMSIEGYTLDVSVAELTYVENTSDSTGGVKVNPENSLDFNVDSKVASITLLVQVLDAEGQVVADGLRYTFVIARGKVTATTEDATIIDDMGYIIEDGVEGFLGVTDVSDYLNQGKDVIYVLQVEEVPSEEYVGTQLGEEYDFITEARKATGNAVADKLVVMNMLIEVYDGDEKTVENITIFQNEIMITINVPENMQKLENLRIVNFHEGSNGTYQCFVYGDLDDDETTFTFKTDRFSTFVLTAKAKGAPSIPSSGSKPPLTDEDGNLIDKDGNLIDKDGNLIDKDGNLIDKDGNLIDKDVNLIDKDGNLIDKDGNLIDKDGNLIDKDGNLIDKDGNLIDKDGNLIDKDGNLIDKDGNLIDKDGNLIDKNGNLIDKDGNLIDKNGNLIDKDGNLIDKNGNLIDKDGNLIDKNGNLIDKEDNLVDENGNLIDKEGNLVDKNGNLIDKDGNLIDEQGRFVDEQGRLIDKSGHLIDEQGRFVDEQGRLIDQNGHLIDEEGHFIDEQGHLIDEQGNLIDEQGNIIDEDGNILVGKGATATISVFAVVVGLIALLLWKKKRANAMSTLVYAAIGLGVANGVVFLYNTSFPIQFVLWDSSAPANIVLLVAELALLALANLKIAKTK